MEHKKHKRTGMFGGGGGLIFYHEIVKIWYDHLLPLNSAN
jgi:hypothetical protein